MMPPHNDDGILGQSGGPNEAFFADGEASLSLSEEISGR